MTLLDAPKALPDADASQLLFQEARERRRRRRILTGIIAVAVVVLLGVTLGIVVAGNDGGTVKPAIPPNAVPSPSPSHAAVSLSFRPVLCYAPPLSLAAGESATDGPLPNCSPASALTASNLGVDTTTGQATTSPPPDAQFSSYPSTPPSGGGPVDTVLLPGGPGQGSSRFVVGPPALTQQAVTSARAARVGDIWVVDLTLSPTGSAQWDRLAQQQFHAVVAVVEDGRVLSAPLIEPVQTAFSTFAGHLQVSGISTEGQARALAAGL